MSGKIYISLLFTVLTFFGQAIVLAAGISTLGRDPKTLHGGGNRILRLRRRSSFMFLIVASVLLFTICSPGQSSAVTNFILDQSNGPIPGPDCTNIITANNVYQTFTPGLYSLARVGIDICTLNPGSDETIEIEILQGSTSLGSASKSVKDGHDGIVYFDLPVTILTTPGVQLKLVVRETTSGGSSTFGWKYKSGDSYPGGVGKLPSGSTNADFFFQTYAGDVLGDGSACILDAECMSANCTNAVTAVWYDGNGACCSPGQYWVVNHCEACIDSDGDEVCEDPASPYEAKADNCPTVYNPDQSDTDEDGIGDACEFEPEPDQPVVNKKRFKTDFVEFNLLFDAKGNSFDVECVSASCGVTTLQLDDPQLKIDGKTLRFAPYNKPWGGSQSPGCVYVRTRSGGVKRVCP